MASFSKPLFEAWAIVPKFDTVARAGSKIDCLLKVDKKLLLVHDKTETLPALVSPSLISVWYERNVEIIFLYSSNICRIIGTVSTT